MLTAGGPAAIYRGRRPLAEERLLKLLSLLRDGSARTGDLRAFGQELGQLVLEQGVRESLARALAAPFPAESGRESAAPPLVVVHDAAMSRVSWEALHFDDGAAPALRGRLTHRYDGGLLSVAKWVEERARTPGLDVLLVIDPTEDLPAARTEGEHIRALLRSLRSARVRELWGPDARRSELLHCFASGEFDVVHYAGHAFFDPVDRARSGILCHGREVLSGVDLAALSRLPALVTFNACQSARVRGSGGAEEALGDPVLGTVGFAEAFLSGGVANYLGTYWPVGDDAAGALAATFYEALIGGHPVGAALLAARRAVSVLPEGAADWADYVFYGNPEFVLKEAASS